MVLTKGKVMALTVGLPGSVKTAWALSAGFDVAISLDDCRKALWGGSEIQEGPGGIQALLAMQDERIRQALSNNLSIVVHNTNILKAYRSPLIALGHEFGYSVQIVFFDVPADECRLRNKSRKNAVSESVMDEFIQKLEVPEPWEADFIIRYSEIVNGF